MTDARHKAQTISEGIHTPIAFEYADEAARLAAGPFEAFDKNKYALQLDTGVVYRLADTGSGTWVASAGSPVISGDLDMDGYDIIDVGTVDGVTVSAHADRHESGGADVIDGYQVSLVYTPINYTAPINDVIGEHIASIDAALSGSGGAVGGDLSGTLPNPSVVDLTISGEEQGSVLYFDGSNWSSLDTGPDGYVLTTHGDGADPTWDPSVAPSDGKVLISGTDNVSDYLSEKIVAGTGLTTEILTDLAGTPLVRYYFDEAASGTTPTDVLDYATTPFDLSITYGGNLSYVEDTGRGIAATATTSEGFVGEIAFPSKLEVLDTSTSMTLEFVVKSSADQWGYLCAIGDDEGRLMVTHINSTFSFVVEDIGAMTFDFTNNTTRVVHIVFDSTQPTEANRIKAYVDGVAVAVTGDAVTLNYQFNLAGKFGFMSRGDGDLEFVGTLYYAAVYLDPMSETDVVANYNVLSLNNDHPTTQNQKLRISLDNNRWVSLNTFPISMINATGLDVYTSTATWGGLIVPPVDVTISGFSVWVYQGGAAGVVQGGVYSAITDALIATTDTVSAATAGIKVLTFASDVTLTGGDFYYFAISCTSSGSTFVGINDAAGTFGLTPKPSFVETGNRLPATLTPVASSDLVWIQANLT